MPVLRCTAKLLKRLRQPPKPPEPTPGNNPLGEWYADLEVWRREPVLVMLNAATGAMLVLSGRVEKLKRLNELSALQMSLLLESFGIRGPLADAELNAMDAGFTFAATRDRSLLASMNQRKFAVWCQLEAMDRSLPTIARLEWEGLFKHAALGRNARFNMDYHQPLDLVRAKLLPAADVIDLASRRAAR